MKASSSLKLLPLLLRGALALPLAEHDSPVYISAGRLVLAGPLPTAASPTASSLSSSPSSSSTLPILTALPITLPLLATTTTTETVLSTVTVHDVSTALLLVAGEPELTPFTVTETRIRVASRTATATATATITARPSSSTGSMPSALASWSLPQDWTANITSAFGVKTWAWGKSLVTPLPSLPASALVRDPNVPATLKAQPMARPSTLPASNNAPVLQVQFPQGSVNPGGQPQGGVGFYAQPIDIRRASNVSFAYSVYFPPDFDFVKGGKMPGLYGGHGGCSGGQQSEDCFSTRLMFRKDGMGELYLYVPKGTQSQSLCSTPPTTYCDSTYGYSIGRGAWLWKRGAWSDVRQDIWLNTPGKQDGGFNIWVNGDLVLHSHEVMYRNAVKPQSQPEQQSEPEDPLGDLADPLVSDSAALVDEAQEEESGIEQSTDNVEGVATAEDDSLLEEAAAGLLGEVSQLGGVLRRRLRLGRRDIGTVQTRPRIGAVKLFNHIASSSDSTTHAGTTVQTFQPLQANHTVSVLQTTAALTFPANSTRLLTAPAEKATAANSSNRAKELSQIWVTPQKPLVKTFPGLDSYAAKTNNRPTTFVGVMFDTFFGGSDPSWASPRQQYSYFNNAKLWVNSYSA